MEQQLLYIVSQSPLLEDLTIGYSHRERTERHPIPMVTQSPPLRGKLILARPVSRELSQGLVAFPGGLNFRSPEQFRCGKTIIWDILAAAPRHRSHTSGT